MKLYIVPEETHKKIVALSSRLYQDLFTAERIQEVLPFNDIAAITAAHRSFEFEFEEKLGIKIGAHPLQLFEERDASLDGSTSAFTERLAFAVALLEKEHADNCVSKYTLYPVGGDVWVVVKQRVHCTYGHPKEQLIQENGSFFEKLIASVYYDVDLPDLAKTQLFGNYLLAMKINDGIIAQ